MKALVLLAVAAATAVVLWVSAAGAAQNNSGGPPAKAIAVTAGHIPLSKTSGTLPRSMKSVPSKGSYAFLLKLKAEPTGMAYNAFRYAGKSAATTAAKNQLATVRTAQSNVVAALPSGSHVLYETHAALAGVAVYTNVRNIAALQRISQVEKIYPIAPKTPSNSYAVRLQKAPQVWQDYGNTGQNSTVAIIDTGIDYTHADFGGPGTPADYNGVDPTAAPVPGTFDAAKFVGGNPGEDFAGDSYDADPQDAGFDPTPAPDSNPLDCNSHGTHVAGIIAGYGENTDGSTYTDGYNALGGLDAGTYQSLFKIGPGMAPDAKIISYKVFGCEGSTDLVGEALDRAADPNNDGSTADHVDVVNMSLGSDFGSPQDGDSVISNADSALGISVVVAAGNGGDLYDIGGSPGDATRVIGVAASVDAYNQIDTIDMDVNGVAKQYGGQHSVAYDWANKPDIAGDVVEMSDPTNKDGCDAFDDADKAAVAGKVVFLQWTDDSTVRRCGSAVRSGNAAAAGAIGAIFGEDQETFSAGITGSAVIPVVQVVKSASDEIQAALDASEPVDVTGSSFNDKEQLIAGDDDKVASFSSRGIRNAGDVKPDVSAVGQSVFSAGMGTGDDGLSDSGTSMATPMVAGLSALIRSQNSGWNPEQVKADIMNTADQDLFTGSNHSGTTYAPNRVGAGRIDAKAALDNQVLAYVTDDPGAVSASFGTIEATGPMTLHKTIELDNQSGSDETYDTSYEALTSVPGADYSVSPSQVTVDAGQTATVTLTLTIDPTQLTKTIDPTMDLTQGGIPREFLADASGRVLFTSEDTSPNLLVPVYSAPRPASVMTQPSSLDMPSGSVQTASLPLTGTGVDQGGGFENVTSIVSGFELQAKSGALPDCSNSITSGCIHAGDEKAADLKYVGTTSDAPELSILGDDPTDELDGDAEEYFAITTQGPWHTAASQNEYDIYIDTNGDGQPDLVTFNTRIDGTDILIDETIDLNTGDVVDEEPLNDRFADTDTALFDSDTLVMPVWIQPMADEGLSVGSSRISYGIVTFGQFSSDPVDSVGLDNNGNPDGSLSTDVLNPGVAVYGDVDQAGGNSFLLYEDQPNTSLTVRRDAASYAADHGMGAMIVHFHNTVGNKAQIVDLDHHKLTVQKSGAGTGTVTSLPAGISCGSTCSAMFSSGSTVTLTATPDSNSSFAGWSGGGCSGTGTCQVTLNASTTVTATFIPKVTLTVSTTGTGTGSVTSSPGGINCGSTCSASFANGTVVTLSAHTGSGSKFGGWSGGGCSGTGSCQVTLTAATSVTASFTKNKKKKDTTKPKVTSLKVKVKNGTATVKFHGTDPGNGSKGLRFTCKLDSKSFKSCHSPKTYKHLSHGKHTVQVKAIDRAGNVSKAAKKKFTA